MAALTDVFPLEEFRILGPIGKGEFGKVHRATWRDGNVDVALKHVEAGQGEIKLAAEQEGARLQELVWQWHPDIVPRVYRDGVGPNGDYFIAMEFVRGESLHDILRRKRLATEESIRLATIVAGFLHRLHSFQPPILHSDLKPEHVLVLDDGSVRIIDFGIAKRPEAGAATHNAFLSVMYAAPERVEDEARNVHPSDDLWALGIMLFEMLANEHPREAYRARIEDAIRRDDLVTVANLLRERPGLLPAECSPQLDAIVRKLLAPQPGHRYATSSQLLSDFNSFTQGRDTVAWQQLVAAGRATRVVSRPKPAPPGAPTLVVPPPIPPSQTPVARTLSGPRKQPPSDLAGLTSPAPQGSGVGAGFPSHAPPRPAPAGPTRPAPQTGPAGIPPAGLARPALQTGAAGSALQTGPAGSAPAGLTRPALQKRRRVMSRRSFGVVVRAILAVIVVRFMVGQGVAWNRAERFIDRIPALQVDDLSTVPATVNRLRDASGFAASRVYEPLANRMLELAEPTIADYRNDMPTAKLPQWKDAATALKIAQDVQPGDRRVRARVRYVDGQLLRIEAQSRQPDMARPLLDRAVAAFREAARLDGGWPDPFLGLAAVHAYGLHDADSVVQDISEAANRGFSGGRREHAEVADVFAFRADQLRATARSAEGDEKRRLLSAARDDYQACIDNYEGVIGFFNSDRNLERCRRLHDAVAVELEAVPLFELSIGPF